MLHSCGHARKCVCRRRCARRTPTVAVSVVAVALLLPHGVDVGEGIGYARREGGGGTGASGLAETAGRGGDCCCWVGCTEGAGRGGRGAQSEGGGGMVVHERRALAGGAALAVWPESPAYPVVRAALNAVGLGRRGAVGNVHRVNVACHRCISLRLPLVLPPTAHPHLLPSPL